MKVALFMPLQKSIKLSYNSIFSFLRPVAIWPLFWPWCPTVFCCHLNIDPEITK